MTRKPTKRPRGGSKPRLGSKAAEERIPVRVTPQQKAEIRRLATAAGVTMSDLLRDSAALVAAVGDVVTWLTLAARRRALSAVEEDSLRRLRPDVWELESRGGSLLKHPDLRP